MRSLLPIFLLALLCTAVLAAESPEVNARLNARLIDATSLPDQARALIRIGYLEQGDSELAEAARQRLPAYGQAVLQPLAEIYDEAPPSTHRSLMELASTIYPTIKGRHPRYLTLVTKGLRSPDPEVRRVALDQAGRYHVTAIALQVADVYYLHEGDRLHVLAAFEGLRDRRGIAPALDALEGDDPALRQAAIRALARIGRPAALPLKERMVDEDPRLARDAVRALLGFASEEDLPALYEFAERFAMDDVDLGRRLTRVIAQLEVGEYKPPPLEEL